MRCKNHIKNYLDYTGIMVPDKFKNNNWSRNFIEWLGQLEFEYESSRITLSYMIREAELLRKELLNISKDIRVNRCSSVVHLKHLSKSRRLSLLN